MSNKVSFIHCNGETSFKRGTIALGMPTKDELTRLFLCHGTCIALMVGAARLAKNKVFNKKLGREFSTKMMAAAKVDLLKVEIRGTKHVYHFEAWVANSCPNEEKMQKVEFALSTIKESDNVNIVYGFFVEEEVEACGF